MSSRQIINKKAIGVFDSGLGGLTVVKCLNDLLPNEDIIFYGDNKRMPYGNKSRNTIIKYALENQKFLEQKEIKVLGVACNTADSNAHNYLIKNSKIKVIGLIDATVKDVLETSKSKNVSILSTKATAKTKLYEKKILKLDNEYKVYTIPCVDLAYLIETAKGIINDEVKKDIDKYLKQVIKNKSDTIVLACTHYHVLENYIKKNYPKLKIVSSSLALAKEIKKVLNEDKLINKQKVSHNTYYLSLYEETYKESIKNIVKKDIDNLEGK